MRNRRFIVTLFSLLAASVLATATDQRSQLPILPVATQVSVSAGLGKNSHAYSVQTSGSKLIARNPSQNLQADFYADGVAVRHGDSRVGITLRAYGYGDALERLPCVRPCVRHVVPEAGSL